MNYFISGFFCLFLFYSHSQFLELNAVVTAPCVVTAKDYQSFLYGSKANQIFRKADDAAVNWEVVYEGTAGSYDLCVTDRLNFPNYAYTSSGNILKSTNGLNWTNHTFSNVSGTFYKMKYIDNGDLFLMTSTHTYRSTNGGNSFTVFLSEPITEIEFDAYTNRFLYTKRSTLTTVDVMAYNVSTSTITTIQSGIPFEEYVRQLISVSKDGTFYMTSDGAFNYIYEYENGSAPANQLYPVGGSSPLHTRALVSSKTGRTWVGSWGFGLTMIENDTLHYNYNRPTQYEYMCVAMFLDRTGFLYYSYTSQNIPVGYIKSAYSVGQPVFFERMEDLETADGSGTFLRLSNDTLMCVKQNGNVFLSGDDGDNWQFKHDLVASQAAYLLTISKHPDEKMIYSNSFGQVYTSTDNGTVWNLSSSLSGKLSDVAHSSTGDKSLLVYQDQVCLSSDTLQTKTTLLTTQTTHPVYGTIALFSTGLITSQNTFLVAGRINESYVKRSTDGGATWTDILPTGIYHQHIWDLYEDDQHQIWLASDSGLFVSNNDGLTWTKDVDFIGKAHYVIQNEHQEMVVTNQAGTSNFGATYVYKDNNWKRISYGHNAGMMHLYLDPVSNRIFGSGMYRSVEGGEQDVLAVEEDNLEMSTTAVDGLLIYPNPANEYITIVHNQEEKAVVQIFNLNGMLVKETTLGTGTVQISELNSGWYTIVLQSNSIVKQGKFVKY